MQPSIFGDTWDKIATHEWDDIGMKRGGKDWGGNGMESPFRSSI